MKSLVVATAAVIALSASVSTFAQSNGPVTREQVRNELIRLENAGYRPATSSPYYPDDIQAAEARAARADASGYGTQPAPAAQSGSPTAPARTRQ